MADKYIKHARKVIFEVSALKVPEVEIFVKELEDSIKSNPLNKLAWGCLKLFPPTFAKKVVSRLITERIEEVEFEINMIVLLREIDPNEPKN